MTSVGWYRKFIPDSREQAEKRAHSPRMFRPRTNGDLCPFNRANFLAAYPDKSRRSERRLDSWWKKRLCRRFGTADGPPDFPTMEQVEKADREQLAKWYRFLLATRPNSGKSNTD
jgi:hypothetical protein